MKRYLLVPSAASSVRVMVARARELAAEASRVSFVLITPLPGGVPDRNVAEHLASANEVLAVAQLRRAGLRVDRSAVGDRSPLLAIGDELRAHPGAYDAIVLASPVPRTTARLLGRDVHWRADALPLPILHVFEHVNPVLPSPLTHYARRVASRPAAFIRFVARTLQRPRLGLAVMLLPILIYLTVGAGLAIFVNRGFLFTELLAFLLYSALIGSVVVLEHTERSATPSTATDAEPVPIARRR